MSSLFRFTDRNGRAMIAAPLTDGVLCLSGDIAEWSSDDLRDYVNDAPPSMVSEIEAELVRRAREAFKQEQSFADADLGTDLFEVLFKLWLEDHKL